jgi:amidophosphoribosyltransferase
MKRRPGGFHEECAVFGVHGHTEAANLVYLGLYAQQHGGQESSGIASADGHRIFRHGDMGLVNDIFTSDVLARLPGPLAIGHNRYSTTGSSIPENIQPIAVTYGRGPLALSHNGNLVNGQSLRRRLENEGAIFQSTTDTEVIIHLMARSRAPDLEGAVVEALSQVQGSYSAIFLTPGRMVAVRDPRGFRPLCVGRLGEAVVFASESCGLDIIEAGLLREVEPGEMIVVDAGGMRSHHPFPQLPPSFCVFEFIYFARPDSALQGRSVYLARKELGRRLAMEQPVTADVVVPVPDSGVPAAVGFAESAGIPLEMGIIRNHYVGRTFIEPAQSIRHFGVKIKLNPCRAALAGKRVVLVDDSIVRGTTSRKIVKMVRDAGAAQVHLRISSPPTTHPCFYGIDTPDRQELIASSHSMEEIRRYVTADSVGYLSREGLRAALGASAEEAGAERSNWCEACFSGDYPVIFPRDEETMQMPLWQRVSRV